MHYFSPEVGDRDCFGTLAFKKDTYDFKFLLSKKWTLQQKSIASENDMTDGKHPDWCSDLKNFWCKDDKMTCHAPHELSAGAKVCRHLVHALVGIAVVSFDGCCQIDLLLYIMFIANRRVCI